MKKLLTLLFTFLFVHVHAQQISGFYKGRMVYDSTHTEQQFELALSEYRDKITGYSYTTFFVNDTLYYSVKRVKALRKNGVLEVEDVKMLVNNFPQGPDKGVRQVMQIPIPEQDSITELKGSWKTTRTKVFYSISGQVDLQRENDSSSLALLRHLYDVGVWQKPVSQQRDSFLYLTANNETKANPHKGKVLQQKATTEKQTSLAYNRRQEQITQKIYTTSDSLILSFYDNGIVDGDTISVYLNNVNITSATKLTAAASKKVIKLDSGAEVYKLVLVAENLGSIPPNTGLLVIDDGSNRYQIHFTADLQTNAAIEFIRKSVMAEKM